MKPKAALSDEDLVEDAADGIVFEAARAGYDFTEANWIAKKVRQMKHKNKTEINIICIRLYTMDSFLYRLVNTVLRENDLSKMKAIASYCYLLFRAFYDGSLTGYHYWGVVYRGIDLEKSYIDEYKTAVGQWKIWNQFSSTSANRSIAQHFGNTLFIINIELARGGLSLGSFSEFPSESEVLLPAGTKIKIDKVEYDELMCKHYIYVTAEMTETASREFDTE